MADFDTKAKRFSGMGLGLDEAPLLPDSDGSFSQGDRQHFLDAYSGIAFGITTYTDLEMETRRQFRPHRESAGHQSHFPRSSSSFAFSILRRYGVALGV